MASKDETRPFVPPFLRQGKQGKKARLEKRKAKQVHEAEVKQ
ncbi:MAG: hypothetical protein ACRD37_08780 [Candidatus Acidiferrales bacterium]